jgi:ABC-type sugar transport system ATPase subunit
MSDRIGVMRGGKLVEIFEHADAEQVMAAALGSEEVKT